MSIVFPESMKGQRGRPFIGFFVKNAGGSGGYSQKIFLPFPQSVTFGDGGEYSTIEMGAMGGFMKDAMDNGIGSAAKKAGNIKSSEIAALAGRFAAGSFMEDEGEEKFMAATKKILNPNMNTTFQGNTIREFTFEFTLVGRTQGDAATIRDVHNTFREFMYPDNTPDGPNVILDYPPVWDVKFFDISGEGPINKYIPKTHECYLTNMSTTFNPSALMFRVDGSPAETSLSLTFKETRTLMRTDIVQYKAG